MNNQPTRIPKRISQTVLNSLKGGVVPRIGLPYITVGRKSEIEALPWAQRLDRGIVLYDSDKYTVCGYDDFASFAADRAE